MSVLVPRESPVGSSKDLVDRGAPGKPAALHVDCAGLEGHRGGNGELILRGGV